MAKIIDITEKLDLLGNPKIRIKDKEIEVRADAATVLRYFALVKKIEGKKNAQDPELVATIYDLLFTEEGKRDIEALALSFKDFATLVENAMLIITGGAGEQGEK